MSKLTNAVSTLLAEAMKLSNDEREELANRLLDSLTPPTSASAERSDESEAPVRRDPR